MEERLHLLNRAGAPIPQYIISIYFKLMKGMPKSLLTQAIAFFATKLLDNLGKIPCTESNTARYQPVDRKILRSSIERKTYAR